MDKDVAHLIKLMRNALSFVDNSDTLRVKLKYFLGTVEEVISTTQECTESIRKYIDANTLGMDYEHDY